MSGPVSQNFGFLIAHEPLLDEYGAMAEHYALRDPNTALIKLRQFGEVLAQQVAVYAGEWVPGPERFAELTTRLQRNRAIDRLIADRLHSLRRDGNEAVHSHAGDRSQALHQLKMARQLGIWLHKSFGDPSFSPGPFVPPETHDEVGSLRAELDTYAERLSVLRQEAEVARAAVEAERARRLALESEAQSAREERELWQHLAEEAERRAAQRPANLEAQHLRVAERPDAEVQAQVERGHAVAQQLELDEFDTRRLIDEQLRAAGWEADTETLRHSRGARPAKGRALAIAEWPTASGPADYVLFAGLQPVAIVEAKRQSQDIPGVIGQAERYARDLSLDGLDGGDGPWGEFRVPFAFATNGRPYLRQLRIASGVWFRDLRRATNHPQALAGWHTPEGLGKRLGLDVDAATARLDAEPLDALQLRDYQNDAIRAVERAIAEGQREILLAMATGTGKTRTAIGLCYRLVKSGRFHRVLFVVDRTSLGEQAAGAFKNTRLEQLQSFTDIYDVKELTDQVPDADTRLQLATVQGLVRRVLDQGGEGAVVPVDRYDCIVVDECHRGYNLDREMSDVELTFRSEVDYVSTYRRVLDHFDAVKIGLTATPALHTTEIFGDPVYTYSYRQAVVDGFLVDHEPPIRIVTALARLGIRWREGDEVPVFRVRKQQLDLIHAPDEIAFDLGDFNTKVVTESFNRVVCAELAKHIDPRLPGKTLVFCATDRHADLFVELLKDAFDEAYGPTDDQAVAKITGAAPDPGQRIRFYKNERFPSVAVTVDLLTTGIDVPEIVNLVFVRRVRSRILYEQMLGRATRLCPAIGKQAFRVFDAVDLYRALADHTDMKPVVVSPSITFAQLAGELTEVADDDARAEVRDQVLAKLQRRRHVLQGASRAAFETLAGTTPLGLIEDLRGWSFDEAATYFAEHEALIAWLDRGRHGDGPVLFISEHDDRVERVERGYGDAERPEDYLESFKAYLQAHLNEIPALMVVTQRPRDLTRQQLKALKLALDEAGYTEAMLRSAWRDVTNQDIAATFIGFIRQQALGSPLVPYETRVRRALDRVLASQAWTDPQRKWLDRIGKQLLVETVVDRDALDRGQFMAQGGLLRLNKVFGGRLAAVLGELADGVWEDAG